MLNNNISLKDILVSFESSLKIEYGAEATTKENIQAAIDRLENMYTPLTFEKGIFETMAESQLSAENAGLLLNDIKQCLAELSLFTNLKLYHKDFNVFLSDVNYLGHSKDSLMLALKYCRDVDYFKQQHENIIPPFVDTLNNISMCTIKRLFTIMLVLYYIGVYEGVAVVANLLYIGGLV